MYCIIWIQKCKWYGVYYLVKLGYTYVLPETVSRNVMSSLVIERKFWELINANESSIARRLIETSGS